MKITLNDNGVLINAETDKSINAPTDPSIPEFKWGYDPLSLSKEFSRGLSLVEAHELLTKRTNQINDFLNEINDEEFVNKARKEIIEINESIADIPSGEVANMVFRDNNDDNKPYELEVSEMAAKYIANSPLATKVVTTNILTGVHLGNKVNKEYAEIIGEVVSEITNRVNNLNSEAHIIYNEENSVSFDDEYEEDEEYWDDEYDSDDFNDDEDDPEYFEDGEEYYYDENIGEYVRSY